MVTTSALPWCRTRVISLTLFLVTGFLGTGSCLNMFLKHKLVLNSLNKKLSPSVTVDMPYKDVEITVIIVFVIAQLLVVVSTNLLLFMIRDVFHIFPAAIARWFKIEKPSTSTLAYQVWIFFIGEILLIITLGVHTSFVLTRKAKIIVLSGGTQVSQSIIQTELNALGIKNTYRDTPYIRATTETPWAMVVLLFPLIVVTVFAQRQRARTPSTETLAFGGPHPVAA